MPSGHSGFRLWQHRWLYCIPKPRSLLIAGTYRYRSPRHQADLVQRVPYYHQSFLLQWTVLCQGWDMHQQYQSIWGAALGFREWFWQRHLLGMTRCQISHSINWQFYFSSKAGGCGPGILIKSNDEPKLASRNRLQFSCNGTFESMTLTKTKDWRDRYVC